MICDTDVLVNAHGHGHGQRAENKCAGLWCNKICGKTFNRIKEFFATKTSFMWSAKCQTTMRRFTKHFVRH